MQKILLDKSIWWLIFGGMLVGAFGISLANFSTAVGGALVVIGAVAVVVGVALIFVRSRRPD